ncbi:ABC transporter transmembrane domain-containing protein [Bacillus solimangrovi]|uniref:Multidrug ABC transporter permease/ATP-binding protein n=1 Tax=Bacillus solimangrovi TaxID=1305675 RepID=A0A1E5LJ09_9BACI|nr:ABC transporter transmembrane domain-containing protein [Bacillus solimangrovi]OEH94065.1 multidrug ABC transporter permease/ATP-binding protein [Bacillus solimangrovi]
MSVFKDLWWFFWQERKAYGAGILMLAIVAFLELIPPKIIGNVIDQIEQGALTTDLLLKYIMILVGVGIVVYIIRYIWRIFIFGSSVKLARQLRNELYTHFTNMSPSFYARKRTGDLMAHATNDLQAIQATAGAGVLTFVDSIMTGGFVLIAMGSMISWKLTLISLIPMPFMALLTSYYGKLLHKHFHTAQASFSSLNNKVQESMNGIKVMKTLGQQREDTEKFVSHSNVVVEKNLRVAKIDALFDPTISLIVGVSFFLSIAFGAREVVNGAMTVGELVSFTTYLGLLIWPMLAFGWLFNIVERGRASYDRVSSLLNEEAVITDKHSKFNETVRGDIKYEVSRFAYEESSDKSILNDIHFQLNQGKTLGIVGKTGAGKTTLLKLLMREHEIEEGSISINDHNIKEYTLNSLRRTFGYVPQDHFLFSSTVADNIAFGHPNASYEEIIEASKIAQVHDDIIGFPQKYETVVGEKGVTLSGGQKQRISIARALLIKPEILILDDSLSAVDGKTEASILSMLKRVRSHKTTIITAHRLSAVRHADLILVLDEGKISERGTHDSLMSQQGCWYRETFLRQQMESLVEDGGF